MHGVSTDRQRQIERQKGVGRERERGKGGGGRMERVEGVGWGGWHHDTCLLLLLGRLDIMIIIMYIYHALINALSAHTIHINLNAIFYTRAEHSPTKTIYIRYYITVMVAWTDKDKETERGEDGERGGGGGGRGEGGGWRA